MITIYQLQTFMALLIFVLLIAISASTSVAPGGYCALDQYMIAESYIFDTSISYNKLIPLSSPLTATVTFAKAQTDNLYQLALSFQNLNYIIVNNRISITINYTNAILSSFRVRVHSSTTNKIFELGFRYLVISSYFPKFHVCYITTAAPVNLTGGGSISTTASGLSPVGGTRASFYVYTGLDVDLMSQTSLNLWITNVAMTSTSVSVSVTNSNTIIIYSLSFLVLRYDSSIITIAPMRVRVNKNSFGFTIPGVDYTLSATTKNTLFGTWSLVKSNTDNYLHFNFSVFDRYVTYTSANRFNSGGVPQIMIMVIETYMDSCCPFPNIYYEPVTNTCFSICPSTLYGSNKTNQCLPCPSQCLHCQSSGNGECTSCSPSSFRTFSPSTGRCIPNLGYYDDGMQGQAQPCAQDCISCSSLTICNICTRTKIPVIGGCTDVIGCSQIYTYGSSSSTCVACLGQFTMTPDNLCVCPQGTWLLTNHCTNIIGCSNIISINGVLICNFCERSFTLSSNSCSCPYGYKLSTQTSKCIEICGDGILFNHPCDDRNLFNGDGCSSTCQRQLNYKCYQGSQTHSSLCFYDKDYQITVDSIDKTQGQNQGVFVFRISPTVSSVVVTGLIESLQFICNQSITVKEWSITNSMLTVKVDYTQDLQGNLAILTLKLNQKYSTQSNFSVPFTMKSKGVKLLFSENYAQLAMIENIFFGVLSFSLVLFVVGSLRHKMIGVQVLTTFQIILFTSTLSANYTPPYILLSYLSSATCNIMYLFNDQSNFYSKRPTLSSLFTFNEDNLYFSQEIICGVVLFCVFFQLTRLVIRCVCKEQNRERALQKTECVARLIYNHGLFPFAVGFLFVNVFAYSSSAYSDFHSSTNRVSIAIMQMFLTVTSAFVFFFEWANVSTTCLRQRRESKITVTNTILRFERCSKDYIPTYLSYLFIIFTLFWVENMSGLPYPLFVAAGITFIFFVWFVCRRPYEDTIHNGGQLLNLVLIIFFTIWAILREYMSDFAVQENEILGIFLVLALIIISLLTSAMRVIFEYRKLYRSNKQNKQQRKPTYPPSKKNTNLQNSIQDQFVKKMKEMNPYALHTQLMQEQNIKWNDINKQRQLHDGQPLYDDRFKSKYLGENFFYKINGCNIHKPYEEFLSKQEENLQEKLLFDQGKTKQIVL